MVYSGNTSKVPDYLQCTKDIIRESFSIDNIENYKYEE